MTTKKFQEKQACQVKFLSRFNFIISYTPSKENRKADSLIYKPNNCPADDCDN